MGGLDRPAGRRGDLPTMGPVGAHGASCRRQSPFPWRKARVGALGGWLVLWATGGIAQPPPALIDTASPGLGENGEMQERRKALAWTLTYNSDLNANLAGGQRRGAVYLQRLGLISDIDLAQ